MKKTNQLIVIIVLIVATLALIQYQNVSCQPEHHQ